MSPVVALIKTLRPHQWVKNLFVLLPLVFSRHLADASYLMRGLAATAVFCILSGAVYTFNDVLDVEADRVHPKKKFRPIAAGALSERAAVIASVVLATGALGASLVLSWKLTVVAALYLAQNLAYSLKLKHVAFVDVSLISAGFLLRVLAGAFALGVPASHWLLALTAMLAMFLALGKRAHELSWAQRAGEANVGQTRAALAGYSLAGVRVLLTVLGILTPIAYLMYTLDSHTVALFHTHNLAWTAPFAVVGLTRFLWLALWRPRDDSPTEAMLRDWPFLANIAAWAVAVIAIVYH